MSDKYSDKYNDDYDMDLDLDFEDTEELEGQYTHVEQEPVKPLVEDMGDVIDKTDLNSLQDMMVMLMKAGLLQSNEKGIYPEKIIAQVQRLLKDNDIKVKLQDADDLSGIMARFKSEGKDSLKKRKQQAVAATKVN